MFNPSKPEPALNNPTQRANDVNDPQFQEQQGYFPYDLTHQEFVTPRFGEVTPTMNLHTVPGDRIVFKGNDKTVLTQISGNLMSTVNEYSDSFFVPTRSLFPINYEKMIPNPTKGDDLPISALPKFAICDFVNSYLNSSRVVTLLDDGVELTSLPISNIMYADESILTRANHMGFDLCITRWFALASMFSRGQLLDYLGYTIPTHIQKYIDDFYRESFNFFRGNLMFYSYSDTTDSYDKMDYSLEFSRYVETVSEFRDAISYMLEHAYILDTSNFVENSDILSFVIYIRDLYDYLTEYFTDSYLYESTFADAVSQVNTEVRDITTPSSEFINLSTVLAYQQVIAQYYTNNTVDNIFNADLYMQNLRSILFPASEDDSVFSEPVFTYNGVQTRYDTISFGATFYSLIASNAPEGIFIRQYEFITVLFLLRNSLRYGDYFSTARPNMLAVGDLSINVENGAVSPIDVTKNLLMQRYLNAANYIGSGFLPYFASIFGVTPSDVGTYPRFIAHYKQVLKSDITTNTADKQGQQTTNLLGYSDGNSYDCFIDDYGVILVLKSYDVLPVYTEGVDRTFGFTDRFDYFNPMLQNIGDQPIFRSEFVSSSAGYIFGYSMRNAELKFKVSRAHGAFVLGLRGFYLPFPLQYYNDNGMSYHIGPDFIRDRPVYLDSIVPSMTGVSPSEYFHFIVSCVNQLQCARKIQATPPVLF